MSGDGGRMPSWMRRRIRCGPGVGRIQYVLEREQLNTVCVGARCPNRGECYSAGTATFMILGDVCTRDCAFCAVRSGRPAPPRIDEPEAVARAASEMSLEHVVVTSVTRDDLPDGGAARFAETVSALRSAVPGSTVEVLVPDFGGCERALGVVLSAGPDVLNHNMETVRRLYPDVRPGADYEDSLRVLKRAAKAGFNVKSGFMVGLGESMAEAGALLGDIAGTGCSMVTAGQYLRPAARNAPVQRYLEPREFDRIAEMAADAGIAAAASGTFVRSSYRAGEMLEAALESAAAREENNSREMARR